MGRGWATRGGGIHHTTIAWSRCGVRQCYQDPKLNDPHQYVGFVKKLVSLNLVELSTQPATETVGLFFVKKKGGKLRLIVDCRRSNCHFSEPLPIKLATGEAMSRIQASPEEPLYMASADLQNAFYTIEMPTGLRKFFGLRRIRAGQLGIDLVEGASVQPEQWIYPRVRVVPMGWSWAMWWVQNLSERICGRTGLTESERLRDGQSAPTGHFWHIQYVDNLRVFGRNKKEVEDRFWAAVDGLRQAGLTVHEIEIGDSHAKMLGWEVSTSSRLRPTPQRIWRIRVAIREILRRGRASGQQLERLLGHMTFVSLCRREGLSVLGEIYTFCKRHYQVVTPLWKSVRSELYKWDAISPLLFCDLSSPWSDTLLAVDASEWGLGVTSSVATLSEVTA